MLSGIEKILIQEKPQWVLVYGDTNSTLAGALAAVKLHIPVAHVEAGLRSFNKAMPEEINRILTDHMSDLLLAPTKTAVEHLLLEGISVHSIRNVGDVMYDAALFYAPQAEKKSRILEGLSLTPKGFVLATVHRAENTDDPIILESLFQALNSISKDLPVVLPLHPRTRSSLEKLNIKKSLNSSFKMIDPVGYFDMIKLTQNARFVMTDSGGLQKEAFFYRTPCLTLRTETEWVELVDLGWNELVPPVSKEAIISKAQALMEKPTSSAKEASPYGKGQASVKVLDALLNIAQ